MSDWGPFEIILVLVLVIGILSAIGKAPMIAPAPQGSFSQTTTLSDKEKRCGLSLSAPLARAMITETVLVQGSVNGCNWQSTDGVALYAQIIDAKGVPLSTYTTVPVLETSGLINSTFATTIALETLPETSTGTLILIPAVQSQESITVRIPLRFAR